MGLSDYAWSCWGVPLRGDYGLYRLDRLDYIGWIILAGSYRLDCIGIVSVLDSLGETGFYALAGMRKLVCYYLDGTDVLNGTGVGQG